MGMDENDSRGEGSDPTPVEHSRPFPGDQASVPSIHSPQLMPYPSPPKASPPPLIV